MARCWAYETAVLLDQHRDLSEDIPYNDFFDYYAPDYKLHLTASGMENLNTRESLEHCRKMILENLGTVKSAPSVAFTEVPPESAIDETLAVEEEEASVVAADDESNGRGAGRSGRGGDGGSGNDDGAEVRDDRWDSGMGAMKMEHPAEFYDGDADNR